MWETRAELLGFRSPYYHVCLASAPLTNAHKLRNTPPPHALQLKKFTVKIENIIVNVTEY